MTGEVLSRRGQCRAQDLAQVLGAARADCCNADGGRGWVVLHYMTLNHGDGVSQGYKQKNDPCSHLVTSSWVQGGRGTGQSHMSHGVEVAGSADTGEVEPRVSNERHL